jgi:membrane protease YdiL (CAAX protease family)
VLTNKAHETVYRFLGLFGGLVGFDANPSGLWALSLPGVLLVAILLGWQVSSRNPWRLEMRTVGLMAIESLLAAAALVLVARLIASVPGGGLPLGAAASDGGSLRSLSLGGKLAISIGAGLYEEMVFRLGLMSLVIWSLGNVLGWREGPALAVAIVVSAALFTIYHPLRDATGAVDRRRLAFFLVAGAWFATLYALRGFGIAVGTHAGYDVAVTLLAGASEG